MVGQDQLLEGMLSSNGDIMEHMRNNPGSGGATSESIRYLQYDDALDAGINPEPSPAGPADLLLASTQLYGQRWTRSRGRYFNEL